ncbi:creatininase family protein [Wenzhouxiangella sp. XN79A]|uniref:creatininase family protein n=1 Tax=Wenzhouxiangella sp. XN79A TaxID=2724193 RepID=UPI00144AE075|nr:creatininase family protein [Wenzhouxiangella sp. XN79A]NKI34568.1 creatininase family protein [Wenzhouxiangella sp. XN79A]
MGIHRWPSLTTEELAAIARPGAVAVQALGAIEQHGPHLPLDTDTRIAEGLLARALDRLDGGPEVLVLPPLVFGASDEHKSFPGTLGLDGRALIDTLVTLGGDLARTGIDRLVWVNGHGGNRAPMDLAALALRRDHGLRVVKCTYTRLGPPPVAFPAEERAHGFHGGALETALMRELAPGSVRENRLDGFPMKGAGDRCGPVDAEGPASWAWLAEDLNEAGVIGDARLGTAEAGAALADFYAERIARVLVETARLPGL